MDAIMIKKVGELLLRKSMIMELVSYMESRAVRGDIKEIRDYAPDIRVSDIVIKEREE